VHGDDPAQTDDDKGGDSYPPIFTVCPVHKGLVEIYPRDLLRIFGLDLQHVAQTSFA
jgi:hypothetical protein